MVVPPELPPPPHAVKARSSNPAAAIGSKAARPRRPPGCRQRITAQARVARAKASSRFFKPGESGGTGGSGRERGAAAEGAVVVAVTVTFVGVLPAVTGFGETVQVVAEGQPVTLKFTVPVNPPWPPTLKVKVAGVPGAVLAEVDDPAGGANKKSCPAPLMATLCALLDALSVKPRVPLTEPPAVGEKVTATVQAPPPATGVAVEQVVPVPAMAKGAATLIPVKVRFWFPVLVTVTVWALLVVPEVCAAKVREVGDRLTVTPVPVPVRGAVCGLPAALSVKFNTALRLAAAAGVKVTETVQVLLGATVAPVQVSALLLKSVGFVPPIHTVVTVRLAVPELVRVSIMALLAVLKG